MATIAELKDFGSLRLQGISPSPRLDSELLLAKACGLSRIELISKSRDVAGLEREQQFREFVERRRGFEPVAYITGVKEFWGLEFEVNPSVLVPRPETELLVEEGLKALNGFPDPVTILDLGTGSGCLAVALAFELQKAGRDFKILALDISEAALTVASRNAVRNGVEARISLIRSDWFSALRAKDDVFHLIVVNPPYITAGDPEVSRETAFEPQGALYAGPDGMDAYRVLFCGFSQFLMPEGVFVFEAGSGQRRELEELLWKSIPSMQNVPAFVPLNDLAGLFRGGTITLASPKGHIP